jgi:hypothetical protein
VPSGPGVHVVESIPDGAKAFDINGDKFKPGISISNSEVGLASLSISAFVLRLVCTNGLVAKSDVSASYRHVSTKILSEFPQVLDAVSMNWETAITVQAVHGITGG